jgi:hypothetical protein
MGFLKLGGTVACKLDLKTALAGLWAVLALCGTSQPGRADPPREAAAAEASQFRNGNAERVRRFLDEASAAGAVDDYYFILVGDIQNSVRSLNHDVFNAIAKEIQEAVDERSGERLYNRIRFVILLGDLVYEGPAARQWEALARAFAGRDPDGNAYPDIARLVKDKPIFPALGNHEILRFRPYPQNRYKDLFDSPQGVVNFKKFFDWDRWIADPHILYPVPADLGPGTFRDVLAKLQDPADRRTLSESYGLKDDGLYHLKFYDHPSLREAEFRDASVRLAAALAPIFQRVGYGTLPVLDSDNMISYAFEAGNSVYAILDSMSRGWHYPVFAGFKQDLYPAKKDQHRLNLFTLSPYNGQAGFYEAVAAYARERGKTLIPMMHHSFFNTARNPYSVGIEYNSWLGLGFPQAPQEKGDPTLMDQIIFSDVPVFFSACVHRFENFSIVTKVPGRPDHTLRWYISGGGGGPFKAGPITDTTIRMREGLYNGKLADLAGPGSGRSIEVQNPVARFGHHYLIVHVSGGEVADVSPRFIDPKDLPHKLWKPQVALTTSFATAPGSAGASVEFSPGLWGVEKLNRFLAFVNWRPSLSLGFVDYNIVGRTSAVQAVAATLEVSPLTVECHIPRGNIVTLHLLGFEYWDGRSNLRRAFLTTGVEVPIVYDLTGYLEKLNFGVKVLFPLGAGAGTDPDFGARTRVAFTIGYRIKL